MTRRTRTATTETETAAVAAPAPVMRSVSTFIKFTRVTGDQPATPTGDGEDDGVMFEAPESGGADITEKFSLRGSQIRYFIKRRDNKPGSEVFSINGNVQIVQETPEHIAEKLPQAVKLHSVTFGASRRVMLGSPVDIHVNPDVVRSFGPFRNGGDSEGSLLTFPNGNKLAVTESYDEVGALPGFADSN